MRQHGEILIVSPEEWYFQALISLPLPVSLLPLIDPSLGGTQLSGKELVYQTSSRNNVKLISQFQYFSNFNTHMSVEVRDIPQLMPLYSS